MTTFVLIHGGRHGGWCWELVVPELARLGHDAVCPDLPIEDDGADLTDWSDAVLDAIPERAGDEIVLVGHSLAGLVLPVVAERREVRRMIFLGALVPALGLTPLEHLAREGDALLIAGAKDEVARGEAPQRDERTSWADARDYFYPDVPEALARRSWERLRRQSISVFGRPVPLMAWPHVPSTCIVMTDDRIVNPDWSRRYAARIPDSTVVELPGGHSPFLSRPHELATALVTAGQSG
jgi:alpha-beta hydrolase superfamily lysophospholipase